MSNHRRATSFADVVRVSDLIEMCHELGADRNQLAILGEGNVSARIDDGLMLVKASGSCLGSLGPGDLVEAELAPILALVATGEATDEEVREVLLASRRDPAARQPSVETLLHAVALTTGGAEIVAHTHPVSVNALLCSSRAEALVGGSLFPDQIVVLGRRQLLVPYVDPGLDLSRVVRDELEAFVGRHGYAPKVIYLVNHGMFVLGSSVREVLQVTQMADKVAKILLGALAVGEPVYLSDAQADRIHTRPDELLRRKTLARSSDH